jgi:hypothetical protein
MSHHMNLGRSWPAEHCLGAEVYQPSSFREQQQNRVRLYGTGLATKQRRCISRQVIAYDGWG